MLIADEISKAVAPPERMPMYEWLAKHWQPQGISVTGFFDVERSRHFIPVFDAWQDDFVREVNILKPVRGAGSLIGDGICCWAIANDPGPYLEVFQTDQIVKEYNETRTIPNFRTCKPVHGLFPKVKHKIRDNEILFATGFPWYGVGPAIGNLQTKSIRYLRLDEVWLWAQGKIAEAKARIGDYEKMQTSKTLIISQAGPDTDKDVAMRDSDWYVHYHAAEINEWQVQCPSCSKHFDAAFSGKRPDGSFFGLTWDPHKLPGGDWDIAKCLPTVRFECEHCSHPILDSKRTKADFNRNGRYRIANEARRKRKSFHWESVIDLAWDQLVELWLEACNSEKRGNLKPKIQFYQKRRAIFMDEESLLKGGLNLKRTVYEINSAWPDEKDRFLTFDRQGEDLFWWTVRAWSPTESRRLAFGKCYGFAALEEKRELWKVEPNHTGGDSAFEPKGDRGVYAACMKYGWIAFRGSKEHSFVHVLRNKRRVLRSYAPLTFGDPESGAGRRRGCPLIRFSKPQMNQSVQTMIDSGAWKEPIDGEDAEVEKEYNLQMSSRVKKIEFVAKTGETNTYWKEGQNDHARDLANGQALFAILSELIPDPSEEKLTRSEKEKAEATA